MTITTQSIAFGITSETSSISTITSRKQTTLDLAKSQKNQQSHPLWWKTELGSKVPISNNLDSPTTVEEFSEEETILKWVNYVSNNLNFRSDLPIDFYDDDDRIKKILFCPKFPQGNSHYRSEFSHTYHQLQGEDNHVSSFQEQKNSRRSPKHIKNVFRF